MVKDTTVVQPDTESSTSTEVIGFHAGAMLMLIAHLYTKAEGIVGTIVEWTQNFLDVNARHAFIQVDLRRQGRLIGMDDGEGTSSEAMLESLKRVGKRFKSANKAGEKNLGKWAPLGIGEKCSFVSRPKKENPKASFFKLTFDRKKLKGEEDVKIDLKPQPTFRFTGENSGMTTLTTVSNLDELHMDTISNLKDNAANHIAAKIAEALSAKLKQVGTRLVIRVISDKGKVQEAVVRPYSFIGRKEDTITMRTSVGPVKIDLYLTNIKQKNPQVIVNHQDRISFHLKNMKDLWKEVKDVFGSGHVQGVITEGFCEILEGKDGLVADEACKAFVEAVTMFTENYGRPWMEALGKEKGAEMFEDVARNIENMISKEFPDELKALKQLRYSVSGGHTNPGELDPGNKVSTRPPGGRRPKKRPGDVPPMADENGKPPKPRGEEKGPHSGVKSPRGTPRGDRKDQSGALFHRREGGANGWMIKVGEEGDDKGLILVNIAHVEYNNALYKGGVAELDTYIKLLVMPLLASLTLPDDEAKIVMSKFLPEMVHYRKLIVPSIPKRINAQHTAG